VLRLRAYACVRRTPQNLLRSGVGMKMELPLLLLLGTMLFVLPKAKAQLTCTPAPCVTSNVAVSPSGSGITVAGMVLAASPVSGSQNLAITANYFVDMSYCYGSSYKYGSRSGVFLSTDVGSEWSGGCQPPSGSDVNPNWDPIAAYDSSGNLFSGQIGDSFSTEDIFLQELPAGSTTWGRFFPTLVYTDKSTASFDDFDAPGIAIDDGLTNPCIYITAEEYGLTKAGKFVTAAAVGTSCDGGLTWMTKRVSSLVFTEYINNPRIAVMNDHSVVVTWVQQHLGASGYVYESTSSDYGSTWSAPVNVFNISLSPKVNCSNYPATTWSVPNTCVRLIYFPQLASTYFSSTGVNQVEAVYPSYNGGNIAINYASQTGGAWSSPTVLSSVLADQFEPCIASEPNNTEYIGVAWLDTRNSPAGSPDSLYDAYGVYSTDGGLTWSSAYRLSLSSGSTTVETEPESEYLGDWTGCAWQNGIFYYAFPSTANGVNQVATVVGLNP
jgi:hypothetical protein